MADHAGTITRAAGNDAAAAETDPQRLPSFDNSLGNNLNGLSSSSRKTGRVSARKIAMTGMFACLSFVLCTFVHFPHMAPFQHMCNVIGAVFLGPWYNFAAALLCGVMRMVLVTGFDFQCVVGAVVGAWLSGFLYQRIKKFWAAWIGEVIGTGFISAVLASVIFNVFLHVQYAIFYLVPFYGSASLVGATIGVLILYALKKSGRLAHMQGDLNH